MNKKKIDWANSQDYEKAYAHLDENGKDCENEYNYVFLLESVGKTVFRKDLSEWMDARNELLNLKGFKL